MKDLTERGIETEEIPGIDKKIIFKCLMTFTN